MKTLFWQLSIGNVLPTPQIAGNLCLKLDSNQIHIAYVNMSQIGLF